MVVRQGDIFWADLGKVVDSGPAGHRPVLVVQSNSFNMSRIDTVVVASITSSPRRRHSPGNVSFAKGEANLPRACAANVSQLVIVGRGRLLQKIGTISTQKLLQVLKGIALVVEHHPDGPGQSWLNN